MAGVDGGSAAGPSTVQRLSRRGESKADPGGAGIDRERDAQEIQEEHDRTCPGIRPHRTHDSHGREEAHNRQAEKLPGHPDLHRTVMDLAGVRARVKEGGRLKPVVCQVSIDEILACPASSLA